MVFRVIQNVWRVTRPEGDICLARRTAEMGTSASKKRVLRNALISQRSIISTPFCECLPFRIQPFNTANRHMHAYIEDKMLDITIVDLTFKKRFIIKDVIDPSEALQTRRSLPPGLTNCFVIGYHSDIAVVQVFYQSGARFYVCDCSTKVCIYEYITCPCSDRKFGLCEAYITSNRKYLVLKGSDIYYNMFSNAMRGLDHSFIEVAKLDESMITSSHYTFSRTSDTVFFGVCPDPSKPSDIYISLWRYGGGYNAPYTLYLDTTTVDVSFLFKGRSLNKDCKCCNANRLHMLYNYTNTDKFRFVNIQIPRNSNYIFHTTASTHSDNRKLPKALRTYTMQVELREKKDLGKIVRTWQYESYSMSLVQLDWPKLSPSGGYAFVGDQLCLSPDRGLKSLSTICLELLSELVMPEDIQLLPLPETFKHLLRYGDCYLVTDS